MKAIVQRVSTSQAMPFDLDDLKLHLRVSDDAEDYAIHNIGSAAAAEIEQFAQIALIIQTIHLTVFNPAAEPGMSLPIGPVLDGSTPTVSIDGSDFTDFDFIGGHRPYIRWKDGFHELTPVKLLIEYEAGFGPERSDIPADIAQALMDQAALLYDGRSPMDAKSLTSSPHMARIGARYRVVQL